MPKYHMADVFGLRHRDTQHAGDAAVTLQRDEWSWGLAMGNKQSTAQRRAWVYAVKRGYGAQWVPLW